VGQAVCCGFGCLHARLEHDTRCTALVFHWARRERVLERDIFRFGTATTGSPHQHLLAGASVLVIT
jgi:hypothetical protein